MTATFFIALILVLVALLVRWISTAIDTWADSVQGQDAEKLR